MFQRLLFCTDFSDGVHRLAGFVPHLAKTGAKQIVFLHVVPLEGGTIPRVDQAAVDRARERLSVALQNVPAGVDVKVQVESGRPSDLILQTAGNLGTDLIILGMPFRGRITEKLFGGTAIRVCERTTIPVMTLRPQLLSTYTSEELELRCQHLFRHLLIPYDGSEPSKYLVEQIKKRATDRPANSLQQCHLCWVVEDVTRRGLPKDYQVEPARKELAGVKAELESINLMVEPIEVRQGDPIVEILEAAQMADVSAIAITSGSMGKFQELSIPSFTRELLHRSWHPILYFPPGR
ncbi:MAG: universal stress protein [Leptolyngbyaceae cyanobacterium HOT.MB2.61]|jgi:nucleotide-binding universal stress UspA family protein|nr:universal stress protein [Leptolyngbyaceae cyanobacterium HOT.MB2.61]